MLVAFSTAPALFLFFTGGAEAEGDGRGMEELGRTEARGGRVLAAGGWDEVDATERGSEPGNTDDRDADFLPVAATPEGDLGFFVILPTVGPVRPC